MRLAVKSKSWHLRCFHDAPENVPGSSWYLCLFLSTKECSNPKNWLSEFPVHASNLQLTKLTSSYGMYPNGRRFSIEIGFTKQQLSDLRFRKDLQNELPCCFRKVMSSQAWMGKMWKNWKNQNFWNHCNLKGLSSYLAAFCLLWGEAAVFVGLGGRAGWAAGMQQAWHDLKNDSPQPVPKDILPLQPCVLWDCWWVKG